MEKSLQIAAEKGRTNIDRNIFRGYDIRGNATETENNKHISLRDQDAYLIGQALASLYVKKNQTPTVLITADHRPSSPVLKKALAFGCASAGAKVFYSEEPVPTGATSWFILEKSDEFDVAVQITGSHNPYYQNGFKITIKQDQENQPDTAGIPKAFYGEQLQNLYHMIVKAEIAVRAGGSIETIEGVVGEYQKSLAAHFGKALPNQGRFNKHWQVVMDSGNGMGVKALPIFEQLGLEVIALYQELDGTFPNHPADPSVPAGLAAAQEKIQQLNNAKDEATWIGIVFDGDGDRSGVIDEQGVGVYPEQILVINYTRFILENAAGWRLLSELGETVGLALDVRATRVVADTIEYYGKILALCKYFRKQGIAAPIIAEHFAAALRKMWTRPQIDADDFPAQIFGNFPQDVLARKQDYGIIAEYISAGYPYHRNYVREQIAKLDRIMQQLSESERRLLEKIRRQYTSAEASGHFFYATCERMPEIMVDDGIYSVLQLLNIVDTIAQYEAKAGLLPVKDRYKLIDVFSAVNWRPVSHEIRDSAPESNEDKFAIVNDIAKIIHCEQDAPSGRFAKKIAALITVDGVRAEFVDSSFCLVRASNTSPMLTYKFEGATQERLVEVIGETIALVEQYQSQGVAIAELQKELQFQQRLLDK